MNWLMWKDYRENRVAVYSALFFMVVPHLVVLYMVCTEAWFGLPHGPHGWAGYFTGATICGFMFSQLSIAVISGNAFSGERTDRSVEFLFSLPISRGKILLSKLLVSLALFLAIWLISAVVIACLVLSRNEWVLLNPRDLSDIQTKVTCMAAVSTTFFCVAWCLSSFLRSTTIAVVGGLITPWLVMTGIILIGYLLGIDFDTLDNHEMPLTLFKWICLTLSPLCFAAGTWYYLRRVEP
jgi:ABC-type transport system involved in multi-copper enzyme maturation permease subunit